MISLLIKYKKTYEKLIQDLYTSLSHNEKHVSDSEATLEKL